MSEIRKTPAAENDLIDIWLYGWKEWSETQADKYLDGLERKIQAIGEEPLLFAERKEFTPPVRIRPYRSHLIVYPVSSKDILILRVLRKAMNVSDHLSVGQWEKAEHFTSRLFIMLIYFPVKRTFQRVPLRPL